MTAPSQAPASNAIPDWHPRLLHPLMGADLATLWWVFTRNGGVAPRCWPHAAVAIATALGRLPFTAIEQGRTATLSHAPAASLSSPIFIVGHWRSGTTFLYELLCRSSQFAYVSPFAVGLPWDFLTLTQLFGPILARSLPTDRFIDSMQVNPDSPQEDEIGLASMQPLSFYHGLYFPTRLRENFNAGIFFDNCSPDQIQRWQAATRLFFAKVQQQASGRPLLIKNPVYTARVALLRQMFPDARFIHIYRNPYVVFQSTRNFYWKLFRELALQPFDQAPVDDLILESYPRMMAALVADAADIPSHQWVELRFEDMEQDPVGHIERIYSHLGLDGVEAARQEAIAYLEANQRYRKNRYPYPPEDIERVYRHWHPWIDRWGYQPPG